VPQIILDIDQATWDAIDHVRVKNNLLLAEEDRIASADAYVKRNIAVAFDSYKVEKVRDEAGTPNAPPPTEIDGVPQVITKRQAHSALRKAGLYDAVVASIKAIPDALQRGLMEDEFYSSQTFERQRPALLQMAAGLGLTSQQVDQLFILGATL
jgi:hypothetical protein